MRNTLTYRRRAAAGLAAMSAGAALLVVGLAGPASAHGKEEPKEPKPPHDSSCLELADFYQIDQEWTEYKISDLPDEEVETSYTVDDKGTADTGDDLVVTIKITHLGAILRWESTFGIDAVYVNGTTADWGSYFYLYAPGADDDEETSDYNLGVPPWNKPEKNKIASVSFCYDEEGRPTPTTSTPSSSTPDTTETPTTETPTTETPTTETPTTVEESTTTTEAAVTTAPSTTTPPTTETPGGGLPVTGSNTGLLVGIGAGLLAIGVALVAGKRQIWRRFAS